MSLWRPESMSMGLDGSTLALAGEVVDTVSDGWTEPVLRDALVSVRRRPGKPRAARLMVAPDLCRHFVLGAPGGLRGLRELQALAAVRASQLFGGAAEGWSVTADWRGDRVFACAALPASLQVALSTAARAAGLSLGLESAVLGALSLAAGSVPGYVSWVTPSHGVLAHHEHGSVQALRCMRRPEGTDEDMQAWLQREAAQESMRCGLPRAAVHWLGGGGLLPLATRHEAEAAWASRLLVRGIR